MSGGLSWLPGTSDWYGARRPSRRTNARYSPEPEYDLWNPSNPKYNEYFGEGGLDSYETDFFNRISDQYGEDDAARMAGFWANQEDNNRQMKGEVASLIAGYKDNPALANARQQFQTAIDYWNPEGESSNRARDLVRSNTAETQRLQQNKINAALGDRGLGGGYQAAVNSDLMGQAGLMRQKGFSDVENTFGSNWSNLVSGFGDFESKNSAIMNQLAQLETLGLSQPIDITAFESILREEDDVDKALKMYQDQIDAQNPFSKLGLPDFLGNLLNDLWPMVLNQGSEKLFNMWPGG